MKKIVSLIFAASFVVAFAASAQGMMGNWQYGLNGDAAAYGQDASLNAAVQEITKSQNVASQSQVDCSAVTDDQFEKLGDAYMGVVHPGQEHAYVEQMMGGEGSPTLRQAHINMGRSYLGCWSNYKSAPLYMPMMGAYSNLAGAPVYRGYGMMGGNYGGFGWFGMITMVLVWAILILAIVALAKWLKKK